MFWLAHIRNWRRAPGHGLLQRRVEPLEEFTAVDPSQAKNLPRDLVRLLKHRFASQALPRIARQGQCARLFTHAPNKAGCGPRARNATCNGDSAVGEAIRAAAGAIGTHSAHASVLATPDSRPPRVSSA